MNEPACFSNGQVKEKFKKTYIRTEKMDKVKKCKDCTQKQCVKNYTIIETQQSNIR